MPIPIGGNTVVIRGTGPRVLPPKPGRDPYRPSRSDEAMAPDNWNAELALECASYGIRQCALLILREATEKGIAYEAQACGNGKPAMALDCDGDLRVIQARLDGYSAIAVSTPNEQLAQFINELSVWASCPS